MTTVLYPVFLRIPKSYLPCVRIVFCYVGQVLFLECGGFSASPVFVTSVMPSTPLFVAKRSMVIIQNCRTFSVSRRWVHISAGHAKPGVRRRDLFVVVRRVRACVSSQTDVAFALWIERVGANLTCYDTPFLRINKNSRASLRRRRLCAESVSCRLWVCARRHIHGVLKASRIVRVVLLLCFLSRDRQSQLVASLQRVQVEIPLRYIALTPADFQTWNFADVCALVFHEKNLTILSS